MIALVCVIDVERRFRTVEFCCSQERFRVFDAPIEHIVKKNVFLFERLNTKAPIPSFRSM